MELDLQARLAELGCSLPKASAPVANYVAAIEAGGLLLVSGQVSIAPDGAKALGKLGSDLSLEQGVDAAKICALNILAQADAWAQGDWSKIERLVKLGGFVASGPEFTDHPKVVDGASDLMVAVLGDRGRHARFAVGAPALPLNVAVEIEAIFELAR